MEEKAYKVNAIMWKMTEDTFFVKANSKKEAIEKVKDSSCEEVESEILGFGLAYIQSAEEGTLTEVRVEGSEEIPN